MSWINKHKRFWRTAALVLLVVAISGPWSVDRIHVPSPHACSLPNVRLDENFCGIPLSFTWVLFQIMGGFLRMATGLDTGATFSVELRFFPFVLLLMLPFLTTLISILSGEYRRWRMLHIVVLALAAGMGLLMALLTFFTLSTVLWGIWLYFGLTANLLLLEALALVESSRPGQV